MARLIAITAASLALVLPRDSESALRTYSDSPEEETPGDDEYPGEEDEPAEECDPDQDA